MCVVFFCQRRTGRRCILVVNDVCVVVLEAFAPGGVEVFAFLLHVDASWCIGGRVYSVPVFVLTSGGWVWGDDTGWWILSLIILLCVVCHDPRRRPFVPTALLPRSRHERVGRAFCFGRSRRTQRGNFYHD